MKKPIKRVRRVVLGEGKVYRNSRDYSTGKVLIEIGLIITKGFPHPLLCRKKGRLVFEVIE